MQLKCRVSTASGVEKKFVSEVLRKYGVCEVRLFSDTTKPRHTSTNLEAEISCPYIGSETETYVK